MSDQLFRGKARGPGEQSSNRNLYIASAIVGGAYGIILRVMASLHNDLLRVMTVGFIFFMPFALGCIAVYIAEIKRPQRLWTWIWLPWLSLLAALGGIALTLLEGTICIAMFLPIGMFLASIGGLVGGLAGAICQVPESAESYHGLHSCPAIYHQPVGKAGVLWMGVEASGKCN